MMLSTRRRQSVWAGRGPARDVVVKNTASKPQAYSVFGQAKTETGGWLGGMTEVPKDGKLEPGKETTAKIRTSYEGEQVPKEIRVEILPAQ